MGNPIYTKASVTGQWSELASFTGKLADMAADCATAYFRKPIEVMTKSDDSPVTVADQETERLMRELISETYPNHGVLGEEHADTGLERDDLWVIDPIDGTKSFISGLPFYGTLIAYVRDQRVRIGAISMPSMGEYWIAVDGEGCFLNGNSCKVSKCAQLSDAILLATSPEYFAGDKLAKFSNLRQQTRVRRYGGDCYIYGMVASGWADLAVESGLQSYDYMALIPVIEEAGGIVTDWSGNRLNLDSDGTIVAAATPELHRQALEYLA
ncbi:MAG: histidinol-phosphatase [Sneathiella sp.]|nr:MAG: histidinol-phosphatase [Sneathiella sp.]